LCRDSVRKGGGGGLGGKRRARRVSATWVGLSASGRSGNRRRGQPNANLVAVRTQCRVPEERQSDQWALLADAIALK